jgi:hypothetical protein
MNLDLDTSGYACRERQNRTGGWLKTTRRSWTNCAVKGTPSR